MLVELHGQETDRLPLMRRNSADVSRSQHKPTPIGFGISVARVTHNCARLPPHPALDEIVLSDEQSSRNGKGITDVPSVDERGLLLTQLAKPQ